MLGIRPVSRTNENAIPFSSKTPGRLKNENAIRQTPMTGKTGKQKGNSGDIVRQKKTRLDFEDLGEAACAKHLSCGRRDALREHS